MAGGSVGTLRYDERLHPAWWVWTAVMFIGLGLGLSLSVVSPQAGLVTAVGSCLVLAGLLARSTPRLLVGGGLLRAGAAAIEVGLIGRIEVLDAESMRHAHGPGLDARAYLCLRGWIPTGVRLTLIDPADPTPYWLVSSRTPDLLAQAVAAEQV